MQVLPLLTPKNFNSKKRSRSEDDFESNYLKKRLILSPPAQFYHATKDTPIDMDDTRGYVTPPESKNHVRIDDMDAFLSQNDHKESYHATLHRNDHDSRIDMLDINGTILPMEHKTGETRYCIPGFVLNKKSPTSTSSKAAKSGQLILYQPNTLLPLSPPNTPTYEKQEDDPMDID